MQYGFIIDYQSVPVGIVQSESTNDSLVFSQLAVDQVVGIHSVVVSYRGDGSPFPVYIIDVLRLAGLQLGVAKLCRPFDKTGRIVSLCGMGQYSRLSDPLRSAVRLVDPFHSG